MNGSAAIQILSVPWQARTADLQAIRRAVFVVEQHVPEAQEWDDHDALSRHVLALIDNLAVGTARLLPDGHIGRMAVLKAWRRRGVGRAMLSALLAIARQSGFAEAVLHAQKHAIKFYEKQGFVVHGPEFMEAGIPHRVMRLTLSG